MMWRRERDSAPHHVQSHSRFAQLFRKSILSIRTIRTKAEDYTRNTHAQTLMTLGQARSVMPSTRNSVTPSDRQRSAQNSSVTPIEGTMGNIERRGPNTWPDRESTEGGTCLKFSRFRRFATSANNVRRRLLHRYVRSTRASRREYAGMRVAFLALSTKNWPSGSRSIYPAGASVHE